MSTFEDERQAQLFRNSENDALKGTAYGFIRETFEARYSGGSKCLGLDVAPA